MRCLNQQRIIFISGLEKPKKEGSLLTQAAIRSELILTSDDLDLLTEFLNAWCAENSVHIESEAAREVATALIDWYQSGITDRTQLKSMLRDSLPMSPELQHLLGQIG
ncbi:hypothetical protein ASD31_16100 [Rhizobium sp. Root482]|nr:hypothetical protein ASD31_16100 [Rhizobium sp. Root482]